MDLKNPENKIDLLNKIDTLTADYNTMLKDLANNSDTYKKSALLYYWLRDYQRLLKNEDHYDPQFSPDLYRGSIVSVNLGFNVGSEQGGLHYGIVLYDTPKRSPVTTIVPLISMKPGKDYTKRESDVVLGPELFYQILGKYQAMKTSIPNEIKMLNEIIKNSPPGSTEQLIPQIQTKIYDLEKRAQLLTKTYTKITHLKIGSVALINQITTISKSRILDPTNKYDILYGLKLPAQSLDILSREMKKFYRL